VVSQQRRELEFATFDPAFGGAKRGKRTDGRRSDVIADVEFALADLGEHVVAHAMTQEHLGLLRRRSETANERAEAREFGIQDRADPQR